ncbi:hypothetical protein [Vibrio vulnificus YJ016]|uniref:Uncharacterized protein n=1 Tax=Vibrio vulnificus (strain YJ016) TaxID=196600 RepID=Q7MHL8_VIBVY|nr:hypothetical protein [Vibrio vulnificus YJ016]
MKLWPLFSSLKWKGGLIWRTLNKIVKSSEINSFGGGQTFPCASSAQ